MKRFIAILIAATIVMAATLDAKTYTNRRAAINAEISEMSHDFGNIHADDGDVSHEFTITNNGTSPLIILSATASCGCTRPHFSTKPIQPGDTGTVTVTFQPRGRRGEIDQNVKLRLRSADNTHTARVTLRITGAVIP